MARNSENDEKCSRDNSKNEAWIGGLVNTGIEVNNKRPSSELVRLIEDFGNSYVGLKKLAKKIKKMGKGEGFSKLELVLLVREVLQKQKRLSSRQLNYWFPLKELWEGKEMETEMEKVEESTRRGLQFVNTDGKKDTEKSHGNSEANIATRPTSVQSIDLSEGQEQLLGSEYLPVGVETALGAAKKQKSAISYFDITSPETIDCTNYPMYRRANDTIAQLKQTLLGKDDLIKQLKIKVGPQKMDGPSLETEREGDIEENAAAEAATGGQSIRSRRGF